MMRAILASVVGHIVVFALGAGCHGPPVPGTSPTSSTLPDASTSGVITTVAGDGWKDKHSDGRYTGDGGLATKASLNVPIAVAVGPDGSLYIADNDNDRIRRMDPDGVITTVAGNGEWGDAGDGGPATEASLWSPHGVAVAADGTLYIADTWNHRIRRVDATGVITTVAGDGWSEASGEGRFAGDGGLATKASLYWPAGIAVDPDGGLYVADTRNFRIRKVDRAGIITTVAGNGEQGYAGDGGSAANASLDLDFPSGLAVGADGSLYIADSRNQRVRKVDAAGTITTVVGDGWMEKDTDRGRFAGDGGPATKASLNYPAAVAAMADGGLYIAEAWNHRVRKVDPAGIITTVAGDGWMQSMGDGHPATKASLNRPLGVAVGADGTLYIADSGNHRIRKVSWQWPRSR